MSEDSSGHPYVMANPWTANLRVTWDKNKYQLTDVLNLLTRAGMQADIGDGRFEVQE